MEKQREYITAIAINRGVIQLIQPDGTIGFYRQRGIGKFRAVIDNLIASGKLDPRATSLPELPYNWSISFEDEEIMGKAYATFNPNRE